MGPPSAPGLPDKYFPLHLLFSRCPAKGSSRRAVPSGEPQALMPNKPSRVELCYPTPAPLDTLPHTFILRCIKTLSHKHAAHKIRQNRVSGGRFVLVTSPSVFIHTTSYSFIVGLLFICSLERRKRVFYDNAEDLE